MSKPTGKPKRIAVFGHFDGTNLGNEATLRAALHHLRRIQPDAELTCISTGPRITAATYGIRAAPIVRTFVESWKPQNRLAKLARKFCVGVEEPVRWLEFIVTLWGFDILVVPGTGLLTDAYGLRNWGPYSLLRWSVAAKICRCQLVLLSVGAGPFCSVAGKFCVRTILSLADFRSYRDETTIRHLDGIGVSAGMDRVFPDLAFSLPENAIQRGERKLAPGAVIGLGVMQWADRYSKHGPSDAAQSSYIQATVEMARWLLARGYTIRLLIGDFSDASAKQMLLQALRKLPEMNGGQRIIDEPIYTVDDLFSQIAMTDAVVATRFHNILLSLLCEKPVISISFHHKCNSLMAAMEQSDYCLNSADLKPERLIETFVRLEQNADALKSLIKEKNRMFRSALDQQYKLVLGEAQGSPSTTSPAAVSGRPVETATSR